MERPKLERKKRQRSVYGAAHLDPADAYQDVPILKQPLWKNEIAAYFFLGGVSAGTALLGSLADLFGGEDQADLVRIAHYLSLATLIPCPLLLIDDLGVPSKFHHMLRIFKPSSPMNLGTWAFSAHGVGATLTVLRLLASEKKLPFGSKILLLLPEKLVTALGIPSSMVLAGYTGVLLGTTSIPVWYTSQLLGALFMSSSFSSGAAALDVAMTMVKGRNAGQLRKLRPLLECTSFALLVAYLRTSREDAAPLLSGSLGRLTIAAGVATAVSAVLGGAAWSNTPDQSRPYQRFTSLLSLAGGALLRWSIVYAGRASANDREGTLRAMSKGGHRQGWGVNLAGDQHANTSHAGNAV